MREQQSSSRPQEKSSGAQIDVGEAATFGTHLLAPASPPHFPLQQLALSWQE
jgi:hypothetical protein